MEFIVFRTFQLFFLKESAILISFLIRIEKNNGEKEKTALYVGDNFYSFEVPH